MARILLINAPHTEGKETIRRFARPWPPLDLLNCAAILERAGHEARLLDFRAEGIDDARRVDEATRADRIVLTTTPLDRWQCPTLNTEALLDFIRLFPREKTILSGAHGAMQPEWMLNQTGVAALLPAEPEAGILACVEEGDLAGRPGIAAMRAGKFLSTTAPWCDLTTFPIPAFHLLKPELYRYELLGKRFLLFETARGCPFPCTFCSREMVGMKVRRKTTGQVLAEIEAARRMTDFRTAYFFDLEFTVQREPAVELCEGIIRAGHPFSWTCQTRFDQVDEELLRLMRRAGCRLIHFGVESGSERLGRTLKKGLTPDLIRDRHALVRSVGIETALFFLFGHPGETEAEQRETIAFARELDPDFASFNIATPYPGTPFHEASAPHSEPFPAFDRTHHALADLERMRRSALRTFYLRFGAVRRLLQPRKLTRLLGGLSLFRRLLS
jgi:radical SAM superfamily enzyme YgiQ (UPF0313 family)